MHGSEVLMGHGSAVRRDLSVIRRRFGNVNWIFLE
jgi:hypothetical protein